MTTIDIKEYAKELYTRSRKAVMLKRAVIEGGDWQPEANMCHHNVTEWCQYKPNYKPVRGWLYFDLPGRNYVKFVAHSAVLTPESELYDITPSNASQDYPFVESGLSEKVYAEIVETNGYGEIHYTENNA